MTQEDKQLLLTTLCGMLPYGVRARFCDGVKEETDDVWDIDMFSGAINADYIIDDVKPYLRPMSSMTDEERLELSRLTNDKFKFYLYTWEPEIICYEKYNYLDGLNVLDWLNSHHFDYRGLIEKGLALEAPKDMYKTE